MLGREVSYRAEMSAFHQEPPEWYYQAMGHQYGPLTSTQLPQAIRQGLVTPATPVFSRWTGSWQPAGIVPGLFAAERPGLGDDAGMRLLLPVGRSGWAIAAGYLGLLGWLIFPLAPFALATAVLGHMEIANNPKRHGIGRVATGYVGGVIGLFVGAYVLLR